ncbi:MAG TPA: hypothetical protein ACFYD9_10545 [Candidatus Wunengus sp. YC64]|uniref:hypothetical protein n=1 Tax=Candidatus Wunengus sp. YC64 TaxID=3367700 RepID=UPI004029D761
MSENNMAFFTDEKFSIPFLSALFATLGASLTILLLQFINRYVKDKKKKIYATSYIADVCFRVLKSNLILKKHTIIPHIEAVERIIEGDEQLLKKMFLADWFDILTDKSFDFNILSEEYKILLGCDDISLIQSYESLLYMIKNDKTRTNFNEFVKHNLKSEHFFKSLSPDKQLDILNTYWDYLEKIKHEKDRSISFIVEIVLPFIKKYTDSKQFLCFSTKSILTTTNIANNTLSEFKDVLPEKGYIKKTLHGGIQKVL